MAYENMITKESDKEEYIQALTEASETIADCSDDIQNAAAKILLSCDTTGAEGEANKDMFLAKVSNMKELAALYKSASKRLENAARDLEKGKLGKEVLSKILAYGLFLVDQLRCEEVDAFNVLKKLREESSNILLLEES